jgi:hypothetical protein
MQHEFGDACTGESPVLPFVSIPRRAVITPTGWLIWIPTDSYPPGRNREAEGFQPFDLFLGAWGPLNVLEQRHRSLSAVGANRNDAPSSHRHRR